MADAPKNTAVDAAEAIIRDVIMGTALNAAILAAEAEAPWLRLPVIKQVFEGSVALAFKYVSKYLSLAAAFTIIDTQVHAEAKSYQEAVAAARTAKTPEELEAAKNAMRDTLGKLIHWDGH